MIWNYLGGMIKEKFAVARTISNEAAASFLS